MNPPVLTDEAIAYISAQSHLREVEAFRHTFFALLPTCTAMLLIAVMGLLLLRWRPIPNRAACLAARVGLFLLGCIASIAVWRMASHSEFGGTEAAVAAIQSAAIVTLLLSGAGLWLLAFWKPSPQAR